MSMFTKLGLLWCGIFLIWYGLYTLSNENRSLVSENIPLEESVLKEVSERLNVEAKRLNLIEVEENILYKIAVEGKLYEIYLNKDLEVESILEISKAVEDSSE